MSNQPFTLDGDYTGDLPPVTPKPAKPESSQGWLFLPHVDVRPGGKKNPSLMDYLSDMGAV